MTAWERMQLRMGATGGTIRSELIHNSKAIIDSLLPDDPSYRENVMILDKGLTNLRMWNYKLVEARTTPQMDIQASLEQEHAFALGDIIEYDGYWICIKSHNRHEIERVGQVEECNFKLRWQNPITHEIHERWTSLRDPSSLALDERAQKIVTGNAQYTLKLPHDEETRLFEVGTRFLIDVANNTPIAYSIIKYDAVSNIYAARDEGFLYLLLRQTELNTDEDNFELMIANYIDTDNIPTPFNPPLILEPSDSQFIIQHIGSYDSAVLKQGTRRKFNALEIYDDGTPEQGTRPIDSCHEIEWSLWYISPEDPCPESPTMFIEGLPPGLDMNRIRILPNGHGSIRLAVETCTNVGGEFVLRLRVDGDFVAKQRLRVGGLI